MYDTGEPLLEKDGTPKLDKEGKPKTKKLLIGGKGAGVTVSGSGGLVPNAGSERFINGKFRQPPYYSEPSYTDPSYKKKEQLFVDKDYYVEHGTWYVLPGVDKSKIDKTTFRNKPRSFSTKIGTLSCARLHGVEPPEPFAWVKPGTAPPPAPTTTPAPRVEPQSIPRPELETNPQAPRSLPPTPVEQPADQPLRWQRRVEEWLQVLF